MSGPGEAESAPMIAHTPPIEYPIAHHVVLSVPKDFDKIVKASAAKNDLQYEQQLLKWAMVGADCERQHGPKTGKEAGRRTRR